MDITTLTLAKKYVQETVEGAGALKGKDGKVLIKQLLIMDFLAQNRNG